MEAAKEFVPIDEIKRAKGAKKKRQAFYTPMELCQRMIECAPLWPGCRALEPSAGDGRIVHLLLAAGCHVDACEIDEEMHQRCAELGANMIGQDFLPLAPTPVYDVIVMNPPFQRGQAVKHIEWAYKFLKPTGRLIAIAPHDFAEKMAACVLDLPGCNSASCVSIEANAFKESGTGVKTQFLEIEGCEQGVECEGFSNQPTYNAAMTISTDRDLLDRSRGKLVDELRALASATISRSGGSCYGINWPEVAEYINE